MIYAEHTLSALRSDNNNSGRKKLLKKHRDCAGMVLKGRLPNLAIDTLMYIDRSRVKRHKQIGLIE